MPPPPRHANLPEPACPTRRRLNLALLGCLGLACSPNVWTHSDHNIAPTVPTTAPGSGLSAVAAGQRPLRLLMVLWRGETAAEQGFLAALQQAGQALEITRIDAEQNREQLAAQFWRLGEGLFNFDVVYSFGTTASVMTQSVLRGRLPQLYSMVSDPEEAGLVAQPDAATLTGTSDAIAAELKLRTAQQLFPIHHIGFLFNARERNARVQLEEMERLCTQLGIALTLLRVAPESSSLEKQLRWLQQTPNQIDTLMLPSDSYLISQSATIMAALDNTPYRVIGATDQFVRDGALLAIAPDYAAMGQRLGQRLLSLIGAAADPGKGFGAAAPAASLAPIRVAQAQILYNEHTRRRLRIEFPSTLQAQMTPVFGGAQ